MQATHVILNFLVAALKKETGETNFNTYYLPYIQNIISTFN